MDYTYNHNEIGFAKYLMINPPQKIWWNFTSYVFDYNDFYFQIECVSKIADTQNKSDEAIIGRFTKYLEPYIPGENTNLVCENKKIEKLYIVRVFLYFTKFKEYSKLEKLYKQIKQKVKTFLTGKTDILADIISQTIGCSQEITCHPKSDEAKNIEAKYSNLIDCGFLIQINGKSLNAFVESNAYGFHVTDDKFFYDIDESEKMAGKYEFIKV